jgi:outer membrane protein
MPREADGFCVTGWLLYNPAHREEGLFRSGSNGVRSMPKSLRRSTFAFLALALIGCRNYDVQYAPFNPRALQQEERASAAGTPTRPQRPLPTTLQSEFPIGPNSQPATQASKVPPATGPAIGVGEPILRMPLRELIQRAVANSLDVKVAGYQPAIDETRVTEAEARFDPTFFTNIQYSRQNTLGPTVNNIFATPNSETMFRTYSAQVGVRQDLESGGRVELRWEPARTHRSPGDPSLDPNPFWTSDLTLQITQPLLRDFGADVNRARIVINRNNQRISLLDFRDALEKNISDLERAYWQLVQAMRDVRISEELLDRTLRTGQILYDRSRQDVGRQQMSQANSSIETRRTLLIRARARVRDLSDQIKRLMNDPEFPVAGQTLILPADQPLTEQVQFNVEDQINTAMETRFELGQQQLRVDNAGVAADVAKNNLLPQLNLIGSAGPKGIGGEFGEAVQDQWGLDHFDYTVGLQLEVPIGNRAARAIWRRAQLQRMQAIDQYRGLVDQVALDVRTASREVDTTWEEMVGSTRARFAAADALAAIEERERGNEQLTPEFVNRKLDLQAQLAQTQSREAEASSNYMIAISRLEQAKGTLLRYNNILMEESPIEQVSR